MVPQVDLANFYDNGTVPGVAVDEPTAHKWAKKAAEQGNGLAMAQLGFMYADGRSVTQNMPLAVWWWHLGAQRNDSECQAHLAGAYLEADGVLRS